MVERVPGEFGPNTHPDDLLLSDYLLGEIDDPATTRSIEEHLASCEDCRQVLAELGEVVRLLEQLPEPVAPRSFRLTPEMAGVGVEAGAPNGRLLRLAPVARWAGLIAAVFLVALLVTDAVVHHSTTPGTASGPTAAFSTASSASSSSGSSSAAGAAIPASTAANGSMQAFGAASTVTESTPGAAAAASMASPAAAPRLASTPSAPAPLIGAANPPTGSTGTPAANPAAKTAASSEAASPLAQASGGHTGSNAPAQTASAKTSGSTAWRWHLAELALALLVIWLLLLGVVLPRWHHTRG